MGDRRAAIAHALGADGTAHRARQLTDELIADADLVLAASHRHRDDLLKRVPSAMRRDLHDPRGGPDRRASRHRARRRQRRRPAPARRRARRASTYRRRSGSRRHHRPAGARRRRVSRRWRAKRCPRSPGSRTCCSGCRSADVVRIPTRQHPGCGIRAGHSRRGTRMPRDPGGAQARGPRPRVLHLDHTAAAGGAEFALLRMLRRGAVVASLSCSCRRRTAGASSPSCRVEVAACASPACASRPASAPAGSAPFVAATCTAARPVRGDPGCTRAFRTADIVDANTDPRGRLRRARGRGRRAFRSSFTCATWPTPRRSACRVR